MMSVIKRIDELLSAQTRAGRIARISMASATGTMPFLAGADFDIWPLAWLMPITMLWVIIRAPTLKSALLNGWLIGIVANTGGFYWVSSLLVRFAGFPSPVAMIAPVALSLYQGLVYLLFAWALRSTLDKYKKLDKPGPPLVLLAPVFLAASEFIVPFIFPWYLAITQAWIVPVIQIAEFTGPLGVSALILLPGAAFMDACLSPARRYVSPAVALGFLVVCVGWGAWRISDIEDKRNDAEVLKVGIVQGNIGFHQKHVRQYFAQHLANLQRKSVELQAQGAELIVWSESSYPYAIERGQIRDYDIAHESNPSSVYSRAMRRETIASSERHVLSEQMHASQGRIRRGFTVPILLGALTKESDGGKAYNSAILVNAEGGIVETFDKIFLLMFGEYIPDWLSFARQFVPPGFGSLTPGTDIKTMPLEHNGKQYRLGPLICYEDILPEFGRNIGKLHPHLLVNVTNDAWFGDSSEPWQHLALSVFRSVEVRSDMIRAVNTGVSAHISATGEVLAKTYAVDPEIDPKGVDGIIVSARLLVGGDTFYTHFGDVFGYACIILMLLYWQVEPRRLGRRAPSATEA